MTGPDVVDLIRIKPGSAAALARREPDSRLGYGDKESSLKLLEGLVGEVGSLHRRLWAEGKRSVLLVLQGLDASGKDGTIAHVLTGVNPQGCRIVSFRQPTEIELAHDYLWRIHAACPARGELGIFDRSHYEDVVTVRVRGIVPKSVWKKRLRQIRQFERMLSEEGTAIVKIFLNVSRDEQARRLQERLDNPEKAWKFRLADLDDRAHWNDYIEAYETAINETSTDWAPWHVVPADHNWVRNLAVAELLADALRRLDPQLPAPDPTVAGTKIA